MTSYEHSGVRQQYLLEQQKSFFEEFVFNGGEVRIVNNSHDAWSIKEIVRVLMPLRARGYEKIRIGEERDGGYVMIDPGYCGIAYSFGVSNYSPWDLAMAERGFNVFQYDASIDAPPDLHRNLHFNKYYISPLPKDGPYKTMDQIITENGHENRDDIVLQMDIEGAEWGILYTLAKERLLQFKQIVVELHGVGSFINKFCILSKLKETHTPVHIHYNNNVKKCWFLPEQHFIYSGDLIEVTYIRNDNIVFETEYDFFPTSLDRQNTKKAWSDIPIGYFDLLFKD